MGAPVEASAPGVASVADGSPVEESPSVEEPDWVAAATTVVVDPDSEPDVVVVVDPDAIVVVDPDAIVVVDPDAIVVVDPEAIVVVDPEAIVVVVVGDPGGPGTADQVNPSGSEVLDVKVISVFHQSVTAPLLLAQATPASHTPPLASRSDSRL
jgi:hypothetical protein